MSHYSSLNPQQIEAVTAENGPVLVLAGPGSGKTRVLTHRVAYLIGEKHVQPYQILTVTFTNKAAREIEKRVRGLVETDLSGMMMGTFHSVCARILRREADYLPVSSNFVIFDTDDQERVVKLCMADLNLDPKIYRPGGILNSISGLKNDMRQPDDLQSKSPRDKAVQRVFQRYQETLVKNNAVDFDDLLIYTARLLEENQLVREKYAHRFQHILVDEFQDTNVPQYRLLRQLASIHGNIFVVGDEDQSIYRWRGADYHNVERFQQDYSGTTKILLEQNYRSTQFVLDVARAVIDRNLHRTRKALFTERGDGERVHLFVGRDDRQEAEFICRTAIKLRDTKRVPAGEIAIMYRTNAQSRQLEEQFIKLKEKYRLVGALRFYGRREVKDVISYLRLVHNPADSISLERVINVPQRKIGDKTVADLLGYAASIDQPAGSILLSLADGETSPHWQFMPRAAVTRLADFGSRLREWVSVKNEMKAVDLLSKILEEIHFQDYCQDESEEGLDRWENVEEVLRLAAEYEEPGLDAFLENLALVGDQDTLPESPDAVTLLTLHAAKGLEFGAVFIYGLDEKVLPHSRALDDPEELEEERRLFYVGITRAKDLLYLTRAESRLGYGGVDYTDPSRFLADIPANLLQPEKATFPTAYSDNKQRSWGSPTWREQQDEMLWTSTPAKSAPPPPPPEPYPVNTRVRHLTYGDGWVEQCGVDGSDATVTVVFDDGTKKKFLASIAPLTIIPRKTG
jgi:DNA helicase-2/ATP-dependent DNA helicase PcrA